MKHDELMRRVFVGDEQGNIFSLPQSAEYNAMLEAGQRPPGFELVVLARDVNPRYREILSAALMLYQMGESAKMLLEAHGEALQGIEHNPHSIVVGSAFINMAANINLAQKQGREGFSAISNFLQK